MVGAASHVPEAVYLVAERRLAEHSLSYAYKGKTGLFPGCTAAHYNIERRVRCVKPK